MSALLPESPIHNTARAPQTPGVPVESEPATPNNAPNIPDISVLQDRMPLWFRSTKTFAVLAAMLCVVFAYLCYRPLYHTDVWGHLAYGRAIWESGLAVLWGTEPLMPLASGVPMVDTAWLSQLLGFGAISAFGPEGLQFLFAAGVSVCLAMLGWRFYRRTENATVTVLGVMAFLGLAWQQLFVNVPNFFVPAALIRPQVTGWMCFIAVFVILTSRTWRTAYWGIIPGIFVLWANLHGSFLVGLLTLACFAVGRGIDIERRTKKLGAILKDRWTIRYVLLLELSAVAVLLNPYGLQIYSAVLSISSNPNMSNLIEWDPLTLRTNQGIAVGFAALVLMFLYRWSPRRIASAEVLLLCVFGGLTLYYSRFLTWWSPIAAYYLVLHGNVVLKKDRQSQPAKEPAEKTSLSTVMALGVLWICFMLTPFGAKAKGMVLAKFGKKTEGPPVENLTERFAKYTPVEATAYLKQRADEGTLPGGLVFNSYEWGDYLLWAGEGKLPVFVATHVHFIPSTIWRQYFEITGLNLGYDRLLDTHGINVVLLNRGQHQQVIDRLKSDGPWQVDYEDEKAVVLTRRSPI